ncbi:apolipoprotein N-acyltransferase [Ruegeria sp. HKCCD7255]|uniref:apolipoprotein N-acyltransferase n=1 Tax=Ruegeria sp. HKCCD7255 TaxID=2683004 RepID=UPI0014893F8C|nr:apolipoprotein N-acyltransferase [Ruegeria sp. HKCCD7255]
MTKLEGWPIWLRLVLAAGLGVIAALGLAPLGYWWASFIAMIGIAPLFLACESPRSAAWLGWFFATGYFAHALSWIVEPFLVDIARHGWMAPFAVVLLSGGLALFWALAFWIAHRAGGKPIQAALVLALVLSLVEMARGYVLTGFPWAGLAQVWLDTPVAQLLSLFGPYGVGAITLLATLPLGAALFATPSLRNAATPAALTLALVGLVVVYSSTRPEPKSTGHTVRLIQPNAPQHQKWDPEFAPLFFARQVEFTAAAPRPDLIVWPETSVPVWLQNADRHFQAIADAAQGTPVLLGIQRAEGLRYYNSMVVLDENGQQAGLYDKHHLAPFGEYVPFGGLLARFGISGLAAQTGNGFSAGPGAQVLDIGALGKALPLICYEAVFTQDVLSAPERPDFLVQITNDAWFGTRSGPYQHLAQARMRAIEQGLPMMRAANTGVSAMIDPLGGIKGSLDLGQAGFVDAVLPTPLSPTPYSRIGDGPVFFALLLLFLWARRTAGRADG